MRLKALGAAMGLVVDFSGVGVDLDGVKGIAGVGAVDSIIGGELGCRVINGGFRDTSDLDMDLDLESEEPESGLESQTRGVVLQKSGTVASSSSSASTTPVQTRGRSMSARI